MQFIFFCELISWNTEQFAELSDIARFKWKVEMQSVNRKIKKQRKLVAFLYVRSFFTIRLPRKKVLP
ncbi:MAG: hypothetical protein BGO52_10405 [Sphingobacteriales bacterium 44-61]|nr:MAG: hypothetical protein BGO52_10405 [Sphingobacteriales bacterium 44-61]